MSVIVTFGFPGRSIRPGRQMSGHGRRRTGAAVLTRSYQRLRATVAGVAVGTNYYTGDTWRATVSPSHDATVWQRRHPRQQSQAPLQRRSGTFCIVLWVETIRVPRAECCGPPGGANICINMYNELYHFNTEWWGAGVVVCLELGADLHMAQPMPLPLTVSCFSKIQIVLPFWYRLTRIVPEKGPLNGCVCVIHR